MKCCGTSVAPRARSYVVIGACFLTLLTGQGCTDSSKPAAGVTITLIHQLWSDKGSQQQMNERLQTFTARTGIRVEVLPAPEPAVEQLTTWRNLLAGRASVPDVYGIDVIWPEILADEFVDLRTYIPEREIAVHFPELIARYSVKGKLVALPYTMAAGALFYRVDLLRQYGYREPPKNWDELEAMAARIQKGERARGHADFWGYVWPGAPSEALTCNALEWQASEGGGTVIENGRVTVDNPHSVRAWERAARWLGSISPPGVIAYKEWDALNRWQAGQSAFMRSWSFGYVIVHAPESPTADKLQIAPLPEGRKGLAATFAATGYGVSRHSRHPREAAMLVGFLSGRDEQRRNCLITGMPPTIPDLYSDPEVVAKHPYLSTHMQVYRNGLISRPSTATGKLYPEVSRTYFEAVHSVLTRKTSAAQAAAALQRRLMQITALKAQASATDAP
jgi:trehalose/maltose transport system substrate-binding protein